MTLNRRRMQRLLIGATLALVAPKAKAWGDDGHRVIGELAYRQLSPEAQARVREALSDPGYETLAEAATWPDTYARRFSEYDAMKSFHYVDVLPTAPAYRRERDCPNGCIVTALSQFALLLKSEQSPLSMAERRRAIYWTAHLMGDIHQPLHVWHPDGKGGNRTLLSFFDLPKRVSAHWIWDVGLIEHRPAATAAPSAEPLGAPYQQLADQLLAAQKPSLASVWQRTTSPDAIVNETLAVAHRDAVMTGDAVGADYENTHWQVVAEQLQKAGVRLAALLEQAFGKGPRGPS